MNYLRRKFTALNSSSSQLNTSGNSHDDLDPMQSNPSKMFIISVDTLRGEEVDQTMSPEWSNRPPLFPQLGKNANEFKTRKKMCRRGVPHALRSAVWITSVVRKSRPYQTVEESDEYGTLMKVEILDHGWSIVLQSLFPHKVRRRLCLIRNVIPNPSIVNHAVFYKSLMKILQSFLILD